jgi:hypothetical protein
MEDAIKRALHDEEAKERKRQRKLSQGLTSSMPTPLDTRPATPSNSQSRRSSHAQVKAHDGDAEKGRKRVDVDTEKNTVTVRRRLWMPWKQDVKMKVEGREEFKPSLRDVNPLPTMWSIWKKPANSVILVASGEFTFPLVRGKWPNLHDRYHIRFILHVDVYCQFDVSSVSSGGAHFYLFHYRIPRLDPSQCVPCDLTFAGTVLRTTIMPWTSDLSSSPSVSDLCWAP